VPAVKQDGALPSFIAAAQRVPMVSTVDVGRTTWRQRWSTGPRGERVFELSAASDVSPDEVATRVVQPRGSELANGENAQPAW
jgi:hypothetical protein